MDPEYTAISSTPRTAAEAAGSHSPSGTNDRAAALLRNTGSPLGSPGRGFVLTEREERPWTAGLEQERQKRDAAAARAALLAKCAKSALKVVLRSRPLLPGEDDKPGGECVVKCEPRLGDWLSLSRNGQEEMHKFSTSVLGPESRQRDVFVECGRPLLDAVLSGQSACLMAYGQTGSGKTFSMLGDEGGKNPSKLDGVIPQV